MKNIGIIYDHLVYFTSIFYILRPFGIFYVHLVYFTEKNLATLYGSTLPKRPPGFLLMYVHNRIK
jgi:hypothetical protein